MPQNTNLWGRIHCIGCRLYTIEPFSEFIYSLTHRNHYDSSRINYTEAALNAEIFMKILVLKAPQSLSIIMKTLFKMK